MGRGGGGGAVGAFVSCLLSLLSFVAPSTLLRSCRTDQLTAHTVL